VLSGERAESALALGDTATARAQLAFMRTSASGVGLVPEQAWEDPDVPADPWGTDPTVASIGFVDGKPAGSAAPLTWAQAQELRLIVDLGARRITDRPDITTQRYVTHAPPSALPVAITSPSSGDEVSGSTTVTGTTAPGASIVVNDTGTDVSGTTTLASTTAGSDGTFSVDVTAQFGTNVVTVAATTATGTGTAQVSVQGQLVGGTTVLDVTDPTGDDNGPGTYAYPTASAFAPGSFDITRFQVLTKDGTVYLRTTLANLVDTFGNPIGAQLLDLYVHRPDAATTSTAAAYPTRNYSIAPDDAWSERIEAEGFASPVWVDAAGNPVGPTPAVIPSTAAKTITIAVPDAHRPGRLQRRPRPGVRGDAAGLRVRCVRGGRHLADLLGRSGHRAEGAGHDHPRRGVAGRGAGPDGPAGRTAGRPSAVAPLRQGAVVASRPRSSLAHAASSPR
jgi:glucodextranase-like protein